MSEKPPARGRKQRGVLMVALMAGIAIVMILSTVAVQAWGDIVRRDNEAEMMFRAQDIVRALKRFQADKSKLPTEFKELMEPGQKGQYFLRHLWKDPLVKDGKWQFVYASPGGGLFDPTVPQVGGPPQPGQGQTGLNPNDPLAIPSMSRKDEDKKGENTKDQDKKDEDKSSDASADPTGLPIAGVKTRCTDRPFRRYKEKTEYSEWVFSIFDLDPHPPAMKAATPPNAAAAPGLNPPTFPPRR